jgi:hypothetical protein
LRKVSSFRDHLTQAARNDEFLRYNIFRLVRLKKVTISERTVFGKELTCMVSSFSDRGSPKEYFMYPKLCFMKEQYTWGILKS